MTDRDALLATVEAHPADDLPRLVYADWLEEHATTEADRARATFIRLQIAEYRAPAEWNGQSHRHASVKMIRPHLADWLPGVPVRLRYTVVFERGFPAILKPDQQMPGALALFDAPAAELRTLDRLHVSRGGYPVTADADHPGLARLRGLTLRAAYSGDGGPIVSSPHLTQLESLSTDRLSARTSAAVTGNSALANVRRFAFEYSDVATFLALAAVPPFPRLEAISVGSLYSVGASPDVDRTLAESPLFAPLRRLAWSGDALDAGLHALASGRSAPHLEVLSVGLPSTQVGRFFAALSLRRLRQLTLPWAVVGDALYHLERSPVAARLDGLALLGGSGGREAVRLFETANLLGLKRLDLDVRAVDAELSTYLLRSDRPLRFRSFHLGPAWSDGTATAALRQKYGAKWRNYSVESSVYRRLHPDDVP